MNLGYASPGTNPTELIELAVEAEGLGYDSAWAAEARGTDVVTVLSWPGETVRIATNFSHPFLGDQVYMIHCHNLEHEDGGMMLNLKVQA